MAAKWTFIAIMGNFLIENSSAKVAISEIGAMSIFKNKNKKEFLDKKNHITLEKIIYKL